MRLEAHLFSQCHMTGSLRRAWTWCKKQESIATHKRLEGSDARSGPPCGRVDLLSRQQYHSFPYLGHRSLCHSSLTYDITVAIKNICCLPTAALWVTERCFVWAECVISVHVAMSLRQRGGGSDNVVYMSHIVEAQSLPNHTCKRVFRPWSAQIKRGANAHLEYPFDTTPRTG